MKPFFKSHEKLLKQNRSMLLWVNNPWEEGMRGLIFFAVLIAVASSIGYTVITRPAATWDAKPATFSERFAPVLPSGSAG